MDTSGEFPCSKSKCGSQLPSGGFCNDEGLEDLDNVEKGDGGWHKLPSRQ